MTTPVFFRFSRNTRARSRHGFVLLELMIALSIFAAVSLSLVLVLLTAIDAGKERNEIDAALRGLSNQLELIHATPVVPTDKDLPDDGSGITYHLIVEQEQMQDQKKKPVTGTYRITVVAKWKSNGQANDRSISELYYQP